jgi:excisionase family DNA binding protein
MNRISIKEAAEIMGVHENTIRKYVDKGILTGYQVVKNGNVRVAREQVEKLLKAVK